MTAIAESAAEKQNRPATVEEANPPARAGEGKRFRRDIEGLRAIAVLLVVVYHAGWTGLPGGFVGVDVFFVISGFLITGILAREVQVSGKVSLAGFYARRVRRILPASVFVLLATVIGAQFLLDPVRAGTVAVDGRWAAGFMANIHFWAVGTNYLNAGAPPSPLQHFWSLAVEEQFYVVWPLLILSVAFLLRRNVKARSIAITSLLVAIVVASLWWCVAETNSNATAAYFSPLTRAWELGLGALVALSANRLEKLPRALAPYLTWGGLAGIGVSALVYDNSTKFPGIAALLPVAATAVAIAGGTISSHPSVEKTLGWRPIQKIGGLSYSIYLWHYPVLILVAGYLGKTPPAWENLILVVGAGMIAYTAYSYLETPVRIAPTLIREPSAALALGLAFILLSLGVTSAFVNHTDVTNQIAAGVAEGQDAGINSLHLASASDVEKAVASAVGQTSIPAGLEPAISAISGDQSPAFSDGCLSAAGVATPKVCTYGNLNATQTVVLVGDSHAAQWVPALSQSGTRSNWKVDLISKSECPVAALPTLWSLQLHTAYGACDAWRAQTDALIKSINPQLIVMSETANDVHVASGSAEGALVSPAQWQSGVLTTASLLNHYTDSLVVLGDDPEENTDTAGCLASHANPTDCSDTTAQAIDSPIEAANGEAANEAEVNYFDVSPFFCTESNCPAIVNHIVTHPDGTHVGATYSGYLSHALAVNIGMESGTGNGTDVVTNTQVLAAVAAGSEVTKATASILASARSAANDAEGLADQGCEAQDADVSVGSCIYGDPAGSKTMVLYGDSHAGMWEPAIDLIAKRIHWRLLVLAKSACHVPDILYLDDQTNTANKNCATFQKSALSRINDSGASMVILTSSFEGISNPDHSAVDPAEWQAGLTRTLSYIKLPDATKVVLGDMPYLSQVDADCVLGHASNVQACTTPRSVAAVPADVAATVNGTKAGGATYIDALPWFCDTTSCYPVIHGDVVYRNQFHITATYATYLSGALAEALGVVPKNS